MSKKPYKPFTKREIILFCICVLLLSMIIFIAITRQFSIESIIYNLSGYAFTIITSVICSIIAAALLPQALQSQTKDQDFEKGIKNLMRSAQSVVPYTYPDTNDPNRDFNTRMNTSISKTNNYIYFGDRALYLTKRLEKDIVTTNERLKITVILADIREENLFTARKEAYLQKERSLHKMYADVPMRSIDDIINQEKIEIIRGLYALGRLQSKYNISVYLHKEIPFIRFEITDDLLAMSFLTQLSSGKKYPTTLLYENDSIFTKNFTDYVSEVKLRSKKLTISDLRLESLMRLANESRVQNCTTTEITKHYESISK